MPDVRIPEPEERRLPRQCNSQKGKFIADSSRGSCRVPHSGAGSESPEPNLLHKFIGWAHAVGSWFKRKRIAKQFHWSKLWRAQDFPGGFRPDPNWQTAVSVKQKLMQVAWLSYHPEVGRPTPNLSCLPWHYFCLPHTFQLNKLVNSRYCLS